MLELKEGKPRRILPVKRILLTLVAGGVLLGSGEAWAVPGLSSSDSVKNIVDMIKVYADRNENVNVHELEKQLRHRPRQAAQALIDLLDTNNSNVQLQSAMVLQRLSSSQDFSISDQSLKTLIAILGASRNPQVRAALVTVLGNIGPKNETVKAAIIGNINGDYEVATKRSAIEALAKLSQQEKPGYHRQSTETLISILKDDDAPSLRQAAARAIGRFHSDPEIAVPALVSGLEDNYLKVRTECVRSLGYYKEDGSKAVPALVRMLDTEPDTSMRSACVYSLRNIGNGDPAIVTKFIELLDDPTMSRNIMSYLSSFGDKAAPAVPKLIMRLQSTDRYQRQYACRALGSIGPKAKEALPALKKATEDSDSSVRRYAQTAINNISRTSTAPGSM